MCLSDFLPLVIFPMELVAILYALLVDKTVIEFDCEHFKIEKEYSFSNSNQLNGLKLNETTLFNTSAHWTWRRFNLNWKYFLTNEMLKHTNRLQCVHILLYIHIYIVMNISIRLNGFLELVMGGGGGFFFFWNKHPILIWMIWGAS